MVCITYAIFIFSFIVLQPINFLNTQFRQHAAMQRDLGVLVHETQRPSLQVQQLIKKANGMLAYIVRGI